MEGSKILITIAVSIFVGVLPLPTKADGVDRTAMHQGLIASCNPGDSQDDPWIDYVKATGSDDEAVVRYKAGGMNSAIAVIGRNPNEIQKRFAQVIERNFEHGPTESIVRRLTDRELAALARHYGKVAGKANTPLLKTLAARLSDGSLLRLAAAFDKDAVSSAVRTYASPAVRRSFNSQIAFVSPTPMTLSYVASGGGEGIAAAPTSDMTLEEIYLEFRTAPVGSLSPASALSETVQFASARLSLAGYAGWEVGSGISYLIQTYDPSLDDAIGGTISTMIDNAWKAADELEQGRFQSAFDNLFGYPVTNSDDPFGDWDNSEPMMDYYNYGSGCDW